MDQTIEVIIKQLAAKTNLPWPHAAAATTNALLAEVARLQSAEGQKSTRETHNKLISELICLINAIQENLFAKKYSVETAMADQILKSIKNLDRKLLLDPLIKGIKCPLTMESLEDSVWPTIQAAIKKTETDGGDAWDIYHDATQQIYDWRIKAENHRRENLCEIKAVLTVRKQSAQN